MAGDQIFLTRALEAFYYNPAQALWRALEAQAYPVDALQPPVLDLGCGDGSFARIAFAHQRIDAGIDLSELDLRMAVGKGNYGSLVAGDARFLPYRDQCFATVFSNCVLEHIPEVDTVLGEVARVLRKDGRFIFTVPSHMFGAGLFYSGLYAKIDQRLARWYVSSKNLRLQHHHCDSMEVWRQRLKGKRMCLSLWQYFMPLSVERWWDLMDELFVLGRGRYRLYNLVRMLGKAWPSKLVAALLGMVLRSAINEAEKDTGGGLIIQAVKCE